MQICGEVYDEMPERQIVQIQAVQRAQTPSYGSASYTCKKRVQYVRTLDSRLETLTGIRRAV